MRRAIPLVQLSAVRGARKASFHAEPTRGLGRGLAPSPARWWMARRWSSSAPPVVASGNSSSESGMPLTGEECYARALEAFEKANEERQKKEQERSAEQFRAWQRAQERSARPPSAEGVAVVKTIVKQARREKLASKESEWETQGRSWLEQAAFQHQHPKALVRLGNAVLEEAKLSDSKETIMSLVHRAMQLYESAGRNGSSEGWFNLGHLYWTGYPARDIADDGDVVSILPPNRTDALDAFQEAVKLGDADAMYFLGVQHLCASEEEDDEGRSESLIGQYRTGLALVENASKAGHGGALYYLALLHLNGHKGLGIAPCAPSEFADRLDAAGKAGDADALFLQGSCFYQGVDGHMQSYQRALGSFLAAAKAGNSDAAVSSGAMLHKGIGVQQDQRRAFELYQMAGEMGNLEGWRNVVACYAFGEGVPQCAKTAEYIAKTMLKDDKTVPGTK